ncbi:MAG: EF-hand domain-containing protein [Gammaproteobacteria bacterium]|nr:EF-hand domain-containing protein [Gammaproteobacteria bacterium]
MKTRSMTSAIGLALAVLVATPLAVAQSVPPPRGPIPFSMLDRNGDGVVTEKEMNRAHAERRARQGSSQAITPAPRMGPGYGGGPGRHMPRFAAFDLNRDGVLTKHELEKGRANRIKERSQAGYRMRNLATAPSFETLDLDGDGRISSTEFARGHDRQHQNRMRTW